MPHPHPHYPCSPQQRHIGGYGLYSTIELGLSWLEAKASAGPNADHNQALLRDWYENIDLTNYDRNQSAQACEVAIASAIIDGLRYGNWPWTSDAAQELEPSAPHWQCQSCGYKDYVTPLPKDREAFYAAPQPGKCGVCKSDDMAPVGF